MAEISNVSEIIHHQSLREMFIKGIKRQIQEELDTLSTELINKAIEKINSDIKLLAKEASERVAVEVKEAFLEMSPTRRFEVLIEVLEPVIKNQRRKEIK